MKLGECTLIGAIVIFLVFLGGYSYSWITASEMIMVTVACAIFACSSLLCMCKKGW